MQIRETKSEREVIRIWHGTCLIFWLLGGLWLVRFRPRPVWNNWWRRLGRHRWIPWRVWAYNLDNDGHGWLRLWKWPWRLARRWRRTRIPYAILMVERPRLRWFSCLHVWTGRWLLAQIWLQFWCHIRNWKCWIRCRVCHWNYRVD